MLLHPCRAYNDHYVDGPGVTVCHLSGEHMALRRNEHPLVFVMRGVLILQQCSSAGTYESHMHTNARSQVSQLRRTLHRNKIIHFTHTTCWWFGCCC